jgi:CheY-like chemotaxis protein
VPRVLIVEDDHATRWMMADDLVDRGYQVVEAQNGADALAYVEAARPDVIVLDLMMAGGDGWSFLETYRSKTDGTVIPTVFVSAARAVPFHIDELAGWVDRLTHARTSVATAGS